MHCSSKLTLCRATISLCFSVNIMTPYVFLRVANPRNTPGVLRGSSLESCLCFVGLLALYAHTKTANAGQQIEIGDRVIACLEDCDRRILSTRAGHLQDECHMLAPTMSQYFLGMPASAMVVATALSISWIAFSAIPMIKCSPRGTVI